MRDGCDTCGTTVVALDDEVDLMKMQLEEIDKVLDEYTEAAIGNIQLSLLMVRIRAIRMAAD